MQVGAVVGRLQGRRAVARAAVGAAAGAGDALLVRRLPPRHVRLPGVQATGRMSGTVQRRLASDFSAAVPNIEVGLDSSPIGGDLGRDLCDDLRLPE